MHYLAVLTAISFLFTAALATPIALDAWYIEKRADVDPGRLDQLRRDYRGIFWDAAAKECTKEQFDILAESLRKITQEVFPLAGSRFDRAVSPSLNRFFIRPFEGGMTKHWTSDNEFSIAYLRIMSAMENVERFPVEGKRGRIPRRRNQIKFKCKPFPNLACRSGVLAQTHELNVDEDPGWSIVLCDKFFDRLKSPPPSDAIDYLNNLAGQGPKAVSSLPTLRSYEHAIIHELFHVDPASGMSEDNHIVDYVATLPGFPRSKMYGATLTHEFAWVATKPGTGLPYTGPNLLVGFNADNYAWYYTNLFFAKVWGWTDDGRNLALDAEDANFEESSTVSDTVEIDLLKNDVIASAPGCYYLNKDSLETLDWYCPYKGDDELSWLDELGQPFESNGGCQLTKECHLPTNGTLNVDPDCKCTCDGQDTSLSDTRCDGFEGELGTPPPTNPSSPPPPPPTTLQPTTPGPTASCEFDWCGSPFCDPPCGP